MSGTQPYASPPDDDNNDTLVQDACQLMESSLSSLVTDAAVLRQLVSLKQAISTSGDNLSNSNGLCQRLCQIDRVVNDLNKRVSEFGRIVKEEQAAIVDIEQCAEQARAKVAEFHAWRDKILQQQQQQQLTRAGKGQFTHKHNNNAVYEDDTCWTSREEESGVGQDDNHHDARFSHYLDDDGQEERYDSHRHSIKLKMVTQYEFMRVPTQTRSHISRALVNGAIQDIERIFHKKEALRRREQRRRAKLTWNKTSQQEEELLTCSEQELRQSCNFFLSGEQSARTVLMILRHLNRIKQIPSAKGKIAYALYERE